MHSPTSSSPLMNIFNANKSAKDTKLKRTKTASTSPTGRALPIPIPIGKLKNEISPTNSQSHSYLKSVSLGPPTRSASASLPNTSFFPGYSNFSKTKLNNNSPKSSSPKLFPFIDFVSQSEDFSRQYSEPIPVSSKSLSNPTSIEEIEDKITVPSEIPVAALSKKNSVEIFEFEFTSLSDSGNEKETEKNSKERRTSQSSTETSMYNLSMLTTVAANTRKKEETFQNISKLVDEQMVPLRTHFLNQINQLCIERDRLANNMKNLMAHMKQINDENESLNVQLVKIHQENTELRETIAQLAKDITRTSNLPIHRLFSDINQKLLEKKHLSLETKKRLSLLGRLSRTPFKDSNEKHQALLKKLWDLHFSTPLTDSKQWLVLGFSNKSPGSDLTRCGILGLQNLVYFSERYNQLAKKFSSILPYQWIKVGISITLMLTSLLLSIQNDSDTYSKEDSDTLFLTFIKLLDDHPKAFEEIYCICFMLHDKASTTNPEKATEITSSKLKELLLSGPKDLKELIYFARTL